MYDMKDVLRGEFQAKISKRYSSTAFNTTIIFDDETVFYQTKNMDNNQPITRFCLENLADSTFSYFGAYPEGDKGIKDIPSDDFSQLTAYQGKMIYNKEKQCAAAYYFYAVGFDIVDLKEQEITESVYYQYPQVKCQPMLNANFITNDKESKRGFIDACSDNKHIYFLYTDKTFNTREGYKGKYIAVYTWSGKPVGMYQLDTEVYCITFNPTNNSLLAVTEDGDEFCVKEYKF